MSLDGCLEVVLEPVRELDQDQTIPYMIFESVDIIFDIILSPNSPLIEPPDIRFFT